MRDRHGSRPAALHRAAFVAALAGCAAGSTAQRPPATGPQHAERTADPLHIAQAPPGPVRAPDPGCDAEAPRRLWPVRANAQSCADGAGNARAAVGADAANWTNYGDCADELEFDVAPGVPIRIKTSGDACGCPGCMIWHIHYTLCEDTGQGFSALHTVNVSDADGCPDGQQVADATTWTPRTRRLRMNGLPGQNGQGFYYTLCAAQ